MFYQLRRLGVGLVVLGLGLLAWYRWVPANLAAKLTVFDQLIVPGGSLALVAKLEHDGPAGLNPDMRGYAVTFEGETLKGITVATVDDGLAAAEIPGPTSVGVHTLRARSSPGRHHRSAEGTCRIFVWPADSRVLLTDVDHTVSDISEPRVPFTDNASIPPLSGAVEALGKLSAKYRIVYLSARDDSLYNKTRAWLTEKGFPDGPVFCRDFHLGERQVAFKSTFIAELKHLFHNIEAGVGDRRTDAAAYLANDLTTFIIDPQRDGKFPAGSVVVTSWAEITGRLSGDHKPTGAANQ